MGHRNLFRLIFAFFALFSLQMATAQSSGWSDFELQRANTAKDVNELTSEEKRVFLFANLARIFPQKFAELEVIPKRDKYNNCREFKSLVEHLQGMDAVQPLYFDQDMYEAARCWAIESGENGLKGHNRVNCESYKNFAGTCAENCSYGLDDALDITLQLLVDQGVSSLGHRRNLLNSKYNRLGTFIYSHTVYRHCCVQDFCSRNEQNPQPSPGNNRSQQTYEAQPAVSSPNTNTPPVYYSQPTYYSQPSCGSSQSGCGAKSSCGSSSSCGGSGGGRPSFATLRSRFYNYSGRDFIAYASASYVYNFEAKRHFLSLSAVAYRFRMLGLSLVEFETNFKELYYVPNVSVYFPVHDFVAVCVNMGAGIDLIDGVDRLRHKRQDPAKWFVKPSVSVCFTGAKYVPLSFFADYRIGVNGGQSGVAVGVRADIGMPRR